MSSYSSTMAIPTPSQEKGRLGANLLLLGALAFTEVPKAIVPTYQSAISYRKHGTSGTGLNYLHAYETNCIEEKASFEDIVSNFYQTLLSKQMPLGEPFEKILFDNLWDLYISE